MKSTLPTLAALVLAATPCALQAGTYSQDFNAFGNGITSLGDGSAIASNNGPASVQGGALRLTLAGTGSTTAGYRLPDLDPGGAIRAFTVTFDLNLNNTAGARPADGFALTFGALGSLSLTDGAQNTGEEGFNVANGLAICFDTYDNGGLEAPSIDCKANRTVTRGVYQPSWIPAGQANPVGGSFPFDGVTRPVSIHWDENGVDVSYNNVVIMTDAPATGFSPAVGDRFAFGGRTGGAFETLLIDNLVVSTSGIPPWITGGPIISEFVADNSTQLDEDCETGAWLEIYNGQAAPLNLAGHYLTDDLANLTKWPIPTLNAGATNYVRLWVDGKNRAAPQVHAGFTLNPAGGVIALVKPDGVTVASSLTYGQQYEDIAYGTVAIIQPNETYITSTGYIEVPSSGGRNVGATYASGPTQALVTFDRVGGLITGPTPLTISIAPPPDPLPEPGAVIRYSTNNLPPTASSPLYTGPLNITQSTIVRARVFEPGKMPGEVFARGFILLSANITNYRGTGPFNSNLPIIVFDSFSNDIDTAGGSPGERQFQSTYSVVLAPDPDRGNRTILDGTGLIDFQGRCGTHVRGETSAGFPQRPYAWELWDSEDKDKDASILGMSADSDWVLLTNYNDKSLLRHTLPFSTLREANGTAAAGPTQYVEVFFNQTAGSPLSWEDYRGVYVLTEKIKRHDDRVNIAELEPCDGVFTGNPAVDDASVISGGYIVRRDKLSPERSFATTNYPYAPPGALGLQIVEPRNPSDPQVNYIQNFMNRFEASLNTPTDPVNNPYRYADVDSFIYNAWWVEIFKQIDGYRLSTYYYKDRGGKLVAHPLWDYNLSLGNANYNAGHDPYGWYFNSGGGGIEYTYYQKLLAHAPINLRRWDLYWKHRRGMFANDDILARIDAYVAQLRDNAAGTSDIWNGVSNAWTNGTGEGNVVSGPIFPASLPNVDCPAGRHNARWQRIGFYNWPNANGFAARNRFDSPMTAAQALALTGTSANQYGLDAVTSEVAHVKAWLMKRLAWLDNAYFAGTTILRPPAFSHAGGVVTAPFNLGISAYSGTAPPAVNYGLAGTLSYMNGAIFYTTDGSDPAAGGGTQYNVVRTFVSDNNLVHATVPSSAAANADTAGKDWRALDFNYLSPPAGVTWYAGENGVGYDDARSAGINFAPHLNLIWNTTNFNFGSVPPNNAGIPAAAALSNVMRSNTLIGGTTYTGNATCYIRLPFTLTAADIAGLNSLLLSAKYDDGFIAYLNGTKIAERNPPVTAPAWNSAASGLNDDTAATSYASIPLVIPASAAIALLVEGPNVLAVQGMNQSASSNDCLQRFRLQGEAAASPIVLNASTTVKARVYDGTRWSPLTEGTYTIDTVPASDANIVVSEIMYNPAEPTAAENLAGFDNDNMFEYIEVQNISTQSVDMAGVSFPSGFTFNWPVSDVNLRILGPGQRAVIVAHAGGFNFRYAPGPGVKIAGVFEGNLGNGGEHLLMAGTLGTIKEFNYEDDPPWPMEADDGGYSLVLNNPVSNPDHNLPVNWRASFEINGTPGTAAGPAGPNAATALLDSDSDGMSDLMEHATGTLGTNGASQHWPVTGIQAVTPPGGGADQDHLTYSYTRGRAADGFSYEPLFSTELTNWQPLGDLFALIGQTNNSDGTANLIWRSIEPAAALPPRLFLQVKATLNP